MQQDYMLCVISSPHNGLRINEIKTHIMFYLINAQRNKLIIAVSSCIYCNATAYVICFLFNAQTKVFVLLCNAVKQATVMLSLHCTTD